MGFEELIGATTIGDVDILNTWREQMVRFGVDRDEAGKLLVACAQVAAMLPVEYRFDWVRGQLFIVRRMAMRGDTVAAMRAWIDEGHVLV